MKTALQIAKRKEHDQVISYLLKYSDNTVYSDGGSHMEVSTKSGESAFVLSRGHLLVIVILHPGKPSSAKHH